MSLTMAMHWLRDVMLTGTTVVVVDGLDVMLIVSLSRTNLYATPMRRTTQLGSVPDMTLTAGVPLRDASLCSWLK